LEYAPGVRPGPKPKPQRLRTTPEPETASPRRRYSDVVARRPPTPVQEEGAKQPDRDPDCKVPGALEETRLLTSDEETEQVRAHVVYHLQDKESPWTSVQRRRAHSFDSAVPREARITTPVNMPNKFDKQRVKPVRRDSLISHGEGPSEKKGKGPDPRNWENIDLGDQDINKDVQQALLNIYKSKKNNIQSFKSKNKTLNSRQTSSQPRGGYDRRGSFAHRGSFTNRFEERHREHRFQMMAESRPVAQIDPNSYLGVALQNASRLADGPPSEPPSSSSEKFSDQGSDSDGDTERFRKKRARRWTKKHGKLRARAVSSKELIKPIAPREYDGSVDARAYHRFVEESMAYLIDGRVSTDRHISILSHYLTGRAYDFYTQKVSLNKESWDLANFYSELFNYCFRINFRMQMRRKWDESRQNEKNISEWAHELEELYNMIGDLTE
jgi:hypothetical protein